MPPVFLHKDHCLLLRQQRKTLRQTNLAKQWSIQGREGSDFPVDAHHCRWFAPACSRMSGICRLPHSWLPYWLHVVCSPLCACRSGICTGTGKECSQVCMLLEHQPLPTTIHNCLMRDDLSDAHLYSQLNWSSPEHVRVFTTLTICTTTEMP